MTDAVVVISVPFGVEGGICATSVNGFDAPFVNVAFVQVIAPLAPTAGVVHDHPAGGVSEENVAGAGSVIVSEALPASLGPLFETVPL